MQGLFHSVAASLLYFKLFEMLVKPAKVRAGIGIGGWTVQIAEDIESTILRKNTATIISEILGCSRQNVVSIMRRENANKIRELDYMALQYAQNIYESIT